MSSSCIHKINIIKVYNANNEIIFIGNNVL